MHESTYFIHYGVIAVTIAINAMSVGISQGLASFYALQAINRQPAAKNDIMRIALIGMTLIETVAVLTLLMGIILLVNGSYGNYNYYAHIAEIGIGIALSFTGFTIGIASFLPVKSACDAIARQPFSTQRIFNFMLMTQVLIQTPIISALIVSFFIHSQSGSALFMADSLRLIAAGLCVGVGSVGPAIGLSTFAKTAIDSIGKNIKSYNQLLSFTFISEAIIETPVIFCLIISIVLLFIVKITGPDSGLGGIVYIAAALCTGIGTLGTGISSGNTGAIACQEIAKNLDNYTTLSRTSMLAQGIIETVVIYCVLLSLVMIIFI